MTDPHVLHITTSFPLYPGHSSGWFVWNQVRPLLGAGWGVTVLAPGQAEAADEEDFDGVKIYRYQYAKKSRQAVAYGGGIPANLKQDPFRWVQVPGFFAAGLAKATVLAKTANLVHAHWSFAGLMALYAARRAKTPFVVTFHGSDIMQASGMMTRIAKFVARRADRVIVHSTAMNRAVGRLCTPSKIVQMPHGVMVKNFPEAAPAKTQGVCRLIGVGRLSHEKGFDCLIHALGKIAQRTDWECKIIGEGPQKGELIALTEKLGIEKRVSLIGAVPHDRLIAELADSHIGVVPSRREGFGMACLEMSAAGLPVVATGAGGLEEIVTHEKTGTLVGIDNPKEMADAIGVLLDDSDLRKAYGAAGRVRANDRFSAKAAGEQLVKIYNEVLS